MVEEIMDFNMDGHNEPIIKIIGVGGGGSNAVEYMYKKGISDVEFAVCNTDSMALEACTVPTKIQLGVSLSQGNGAGNNPMNGEQAAIENLDDVIDSFSENTKMIFLSAGMGGGTGTGASPVIAKAAKAKGILTVAIVTIPFRFEGPQRIKQAVEGISRLGEYVDSLLVIDNEKLKDIYGDLGLSNAFAKADDIVANAAQGISELITLPGYVNVDFEDVKTVMKDSGVAVMGAATARGEDRAIEAIRVALESPLLDNSRITGAQEILLNIVSGVGDNEISMDEVTSITDHVLLQVGGEAQVIWGVGTNAELKEDISVTIVATGFEAKTIEEIINEPYIKDIPKPKTLITQELEEKRNREEEDNNPETFEDDSEDYQVTNSDAISNEDLEDEEISNGDSSQEEDIVSNDIADDENLEKVISEPQESEKGVDLENVESVSIDLDIDSKEDILDLSSSEGEEINESDFSGLKVEEESKEIISLNEDATVSDLYSDENILEDTVEDEDIFEINESQPSGNNESVGAEVDDSVEEVLNDNTPEVEEEKPEIENIEPENAEDITEESKDETLIETEDDLISMSGSTNNEQVVSTLSKYSTTNIESESSKPIEIKNVDIVTAEPEVKDEEKVVNKPDFKVNNKAVLEVIEKTAPKNSPQEPVKTKLNKVRDVYYGEVVMKPEMEEGLIRKVENQPAYKRRKAIN